VDPIRQEGRILLWDVDNSSLGGWTDGSLVAHFKSVDGFWGAVKVDIAEDEEGCAVQHHCLFSPPESITGLLARLSHD
jgi:hypothetical protein